MNIPDQTSRNVFGAGSLLSLAKTMAFVMAGLTTLMGTSAQADEDDTFRIGVMLFDSNLTSDVTAPLEVFGAAITNEVIEDVEIVTIATKAGLIKTHEGLMIAAEYSVDNAPELEAILVGSSYDMDSVLADDAGFLKGVRATTYPGGEIWLKLNHPSINIDINETVVVDKNVITSNGPMVSCAAAFKLLEKVSGEDKAQEISELLYFPRLVRAYHEANS
ncbi:hypothetical protein GG681_02430 [Epibacterium sp. SM1969]|uniref:DJ-1/PfpI family protein n=1 Tax=Tritonibacter aquimaris TaxID=2663379 RepID=A0A844ASW4_9RHOB|nr:hypothetical protein [Tritonibacter aquimaris]MQY41484.1 hypothetical protein [Tritonibacter aquimaris]